VKEAGSLVTNLHRVESLKDVWKLIGGKCVPGQLAMLFNLSVNFKETRPADTNNQEPLPPLKKA
jgi:hypothetical protein